VWTPLQRAARRLVAELAGVQMASEDEDEVVAVVNAVLAGWEGGRLDRNGDIVRICWDNKAVLDQMERRTAKQILLLARIISELGRLYADFKANVSRQSVCPELFSPGLASPDELLQAVVSRAEAEGPIPFSDDWLDAEIKRIDE